MDEDDDEDGDWVERMERNLKEVPLSQIEEVIDDRLEELSGPSMSDEDVLEILREFDHENVLAEETNIELVRKVPPAQRPAFFRYCITHMFLRMAEDESATELVNAMGRAGMYRKVEDSSTRPWRGVFGPAIQFEPTLLGMIQACLRPLVAHNSDRSDLNGDPRLLETLRLVLPPLRPGVGSAIGSLGQATPENIHRCTAAAIFVFAQRSSSFTQAILEGNDESMKGMGKDQRLDHAMPEMLTFVYFLLSSTGLYINLIEGIVKNDPLLRKVPGTNAYEATTAGKMVEWIN